MEASDMKELRVILDNIHVLNDEWFDTFPTEEGQTGIHDALEYEIAKADKILAKRPRNCDVGTPDEQAERFYKHCQSFLSRDGIKACTGCPCCGVVMYGKCELAWAQMPYKAQEGAGE